MDTKMKKQIAKEWNMKVKDIDWNFVEEINNKYTKEWKKATYESWYGIQN